MGSREEMLGNEPIGKLLTRLSTPAIIGMIVNALYNLTDTAFLGNSSQGVNALNALSIAFPFQTIMVAISLMFGVGASSVMSVALGRREYDKVENIVGSAFTAATISAIVWAFFAIIFMEPLFDLFSASEGVRPLATQYLTIVYIANIVFTNSYVCNNVLRAEGNTMAAMTLMIIGLGVNIILDPIFIYESVSLGVFTISGLGLGVQGAAIATSIGQMTAIMYALYFAKTNDTNLKISLSHLKVKIKLLSEICRVGFPSFIRNIIASLISMIMFSLLIKYGNLLPNIEHGGEYAQAVFGTVNKVIMFMIMPSFGVIQGMQPIVGFNYGAKKYDRVMEVTNLCFKSLFIYFIFVWTVSMFIPSLVLSIFTNDETFILIGNNVLRITLLMYPLLPINIVSSSFFQALKKPKEAFILTASRQLIFLIPLVYTVPVFFPDHLKLYALFACYPLSDTLSIILSFFVYKKGSKNLHKEALDVEKQVA
ncbi:MAG: MATE family efflux transporter [Lachnospirales bacterium]